MSNVITSKPWVSSTNQSINLVERISHIELLAPRSRNDTEKCFATDHGITRKHTVGVFNAVSFDEELAFLPLHLFKLGFDIAINMPNGVKQ